MLHESRKTFREKFVGQLAMQVGRPMIEVCGNSGTHGVITSIHFTAENGDITIIIETAKGPAVRADVDHLVPTFSTWIPNALAFKIRYLNGSLFLVIPEGVTVPN